MSTTIRRTDIIDVLPEHHTAFLDATADLANQSKGFGVHLEMHPCNRLGGCVVEFVYTDHANMAALEQSDPYRMWRSYSVLQNQRIHKNTLVVANGCFDVLHAGHVHLLKEAKAQGTRLLVAINSDDSVVQLKGRCVHSAGDRRTVLEAIRYVDEVVVFDTEQDLLDLLKKLQPDVLVKGDEPGRPVPGSEYAGRLHRVVKLAGLSTSEAIRKLTTC